jgi:hypothetical protein
VRCQAEPVIQIGNLRDGIFVPATSGPRALRVFTAGLAPTFWPDVGSAS